jgi:predicted Zn-dependent protease
MKAVEMRLGHLGDVYLRAGQPERAIAAFQEAVERCPVRCTQALGALLQTYLQTGRLADGVAYFRDFTRTHPEHPDGPRHLARLLEAAGQATP